MTNIYFSQFWRLESPRSSQKQIWCLVRACLLGPHMMEGTKDLTGVSFIRALIPFKREPSS